ncbi:hypothetical protein BMR06_11560, partial [Methylococcaceae bacterium HT5]
MCGGFVHLSDKNATADNLRRLRAIFLYFQRGKDQEPVKRGVAIFAKACFGHPSPSKQQKLNAT